MSSRSSSQASRKRARIAMSGPWANRPGAWVAGASRNAKRKTTNTRLVRQPGIVAETQQVTLRYADEISMNPGAGGIDAQFYRANGVFDPDASVGGHQPMGFDQWATFYNHYTVLSSRIKVSPIAPGITSPNSKWGVTRQADAIVPSSGLEIIERGKGAYAMLGNNQGAFGVKSLSTNFSAKREFGLKTDALVLANSSLRAAVSADPVEQSYFLIWREAVPTSDDTSTSYFIVEIEYTVQFTERKTLGQS